MSSSAQQQPPETVKDALAKVAEQTKHVHETLLVSGAAPEVVEAYETLVQSLNSFVCVLLDTCSAHVPEILDSVVFVAPAPDPPPPQS